MLCSYSSSGLESKHGGRLAVCGADLVFDFIPAGPIGSVVGSNRSMCIAPD